MSFLFTESDRKAKTSYSIAQMLLKIISLTSKININFTFFMHSVFIVTSPAGASAKYCNKRVCVCLSVCMSVYKLIFRTKRAIFTKFLCVSLIVVACSFLAGWQTPKEKGQFWGFSTPLTWDHTKMTEPIEMPFGLMTREGPRCHALDGGPDPQGEWTFF